MRIENHTIKIPAREGCPEHMIFCRDYGNENATRTAFCVHGMMRNGDDFDLLARELVEHGYRVLVPDMAGRGNSQWLEDASGYIYPNYVEDCKFLLQNFHLRQVDFIGTSMGGIIGMLIAASDTRTLPFIRRLVLNDVGSFIPKEALAHIYSYLNALPKQFVTREDAEHFIRTNYTEFGIANDRWDAFINRTIEPDNKGGLRLRCDPAIIEPIRRDTKSFTEIQDVSLSIAWEQVHAPTLIIRGELSGLLSPQTIAAMKEANPRTMSRQFSGCGHAPALESADQIHTIMEFLSPTKLQSTGLQSGVVAF